MTFIRNAVNRRAAGFSQPEGALPRSRSRGDAPRIREMQDLPDARAVRPGQSDPAWKPWLSVGTLQSKLSG